MRAAVYHDRGDVRIENVDEPNAGPGEVKIRVPFNGICGSDLHEYYAGPMMVPVGAPHPITGVTAPVIIGHEFGGYVVDAGDDVEGLVPGQLVAVEPPVVCGHCHWCGTGHQNLCDNLAFTGFNTGTGGLAEFAVVSRSMVHVVPADFTPQQAAIIEPLSVAYHAVMRAETAPGDTVVVHGGGPIGVGAFLAFRYLGNEVIVVEPSPSRRATLAALGAEHLIDPTAVDAVAVVRELTNGLGAAASVDAAGVPASFEAALATTAKQGTFVMVATYEQPFIFPYGLLFSELNVRASTAYCNDYPPVIAAMADGAYPLDGWVDEIPLDDLIERGYEPLRRGEAMKILVQVSDG